MGKNVGLIFWGLVGDFSDFFWFFFVVKKDKSCFKSILHRNCLYHFKSLFLIQDKPLFGPLSLLPCFPKCFWGWFGISIWQNLFCLSAPHCNTGDFWGDHNQKDTPGLKKASPKCHPAAWRSKGSGAESSSGPTQPHKGNLTLCSFGEAFISHA